MRTKISVRQGTTLVEVLVVIGIGATLISVLLPAVQRVRNTAYRISCQNNLRQLGLAAHQYLESRGRMPPGWLPKSVPVGRYTGWLVALLANLEHNNLANTIEPAFRESPSPFVNPPHIGLSTTIPLFSCTADYRTSHPQTSLVSGRKVGLTSYLGVSGKSFISNDGVLFGSSQVAFGDIVDGLSNTVLIGERPPSADLQLGWWYAGVGLYHDGTGDQVLGVRELNRLPRRVTGCRPGEQRFSPGQLTNQCDVFHFWSLHPGGANFAMCDGSVHFLSYSADSILPALATRAGNEAVELP